MAEAKSQPQRKRLQTTFHRTFPLSRPQLTSVLKAAHVGRSEGSGKCLSTESLRDVAGLGTVQVEAAPRYARACNLLDDKLCLTPFGDFVREHDSLLHSPQTQWLMHYHLCSQHGIGPSFWSRIVTTRFRSGDVFSHSEIADDIMSVAMESEGKEIKLDYAKTTATAFLGTYMHKDALGDLRLLEERYDGSYLVLDPKPPSPVVFGVALLHHWQATYGNQLTINLDDLSAEGGLGDIFMIGGGRINILLSRLQEEGYVEVYRLAPPYRVVLRQTDPQPLLEKLYAFDDD